MKGVDLYLLEGVPNGKLRFTGDLNKPFKQRVRRLILARKDDYKMSYFAYHYCRFVEIDPEIRQIIVDHKAKIWARQYCHHVEEDEQMRLIANG